MRLWYEMRAPKSQALEDDDGGGGRRGAAGEGWQRERGECEKEDDEGGRLSTEARPEPADDESRRQEAEELRAMPPSPSAPKHEAGVWHVGL